jgi:hypothetical protein
MSKPQIKNDLSPTFGAQEAADALNEQGFLFQQKIREAIQNGIDFTKQAAQPWKILANEYPVTAADGSQTRIDLLLNHITQRNVFICLECKRSNPKYKTWLFFDKDHARSQPFVEQRKFQSGTGSLDATYKHEISRTVDSNVPIFNYYLEAGLKRGTERASNTDRIEQAFRQVIEGSSGLMEKMSLYEETNARSFCRSIPVVVTTAQLFEADFEASKIPLETGMIEPSSINLISHNFCAVNYHADDSLSIKSDDSNYRKEDAVSDMNFFQIRTVFIVHAAAINNFLIWAGERLTEHP